MNAPTHNRTPWLLALIVASIAVAGYVVWTLSEERGARAQESVEVVDLAARPTRPTPRGLEPSGEEGGDGVERLRIRVIRRLPHDPGAFTQGLQVHADGRLFESTGLNGHSTVRQVALDSGEVQRSFSVDRNYFAEGLTIVGDRLIQLTWQSGRAFEYDLETFALRREFEYDGEGWGLCLQDAEQAAGPGPRLVMSDGSSTLTFRDPDSFEQTGAVQVRRGRRGVSRLNELECVGDAVYANVWQTDEIVRIDPSTGRVTATIDASGLLTAQDRSEHDVDVLNGIAYLPDSEHFLITGKRWPAMFEVVFE